MITSMPSVPLVDDFNRPDDPGPLSSHGWVVRGDPLEAEGNLQIIDNQVRRQGTATWGSQVYGVPFGQDFETRLDAVTFTASDQVNFWLRYYVDENGDETAYVVNVHKDEVVYARWDADVPTQLGASEVVTINDGDTFGARLLGSRLEYWLNDALDSFRVDTVHVVPGRVLLESKELSFKGDNFYAGPFVQSSPVEFLSSQSGLGQPGKHLVSITPDDHYDLPQHVRGIYIGSSGALNLIANGDTATATLSVTDVGAVIPIITKRVMDTGTVASNLVGIW
jgi:hypothetical protein